MHAKKTRDRKKQFLDLSESIIGEMEKEAQSLREYMLSKQLMTEEEYRKYQQRDLLCRQEYGYQVKNIKIRFALNYLILMDCVI